MREKQIRWLANSASKIIFVDQIKRDEIEVGLNFPCRLHLEELPLLEGKEFSKLKSLSLSAYGDATPRLMLKDWIGKDMVDRDR